MAAVALGVRRVGRRALRIVGAGVEAQVSILCTQLGDICDAYVPVPKTLRDGRWRLILSAVQASMEFSIDAPFGACTLKLSSKNLGMSSANADII